MKFQKEISMLIMFVNIILCSVIDPDEPEMADYEIEHIDILRKNAAECTLFLNKNKEFPITIPGRVLLVGSGARNTIKGEVDQVMSNQDIIQHVKKD